MSDNTLVLNDDNFENDVLNSETPVLVDFWADWCGPCKILSPLVDAVANDPAYSDRLKVGKLNIDENSETTQRYGVRGIPTLILFQNGQPAATKIGALSKSQLGHWLDENL